jgi:Basic region leucine zipper
MIVRNHATIRLPFHTWPLTFCLGLLLPENTKWTLFLSRLSFSPFFLFLFPTSQSLHQTTPYNTQASIQDALTKLLPRRSPHSVAKIPSSHDSSSFSSQIKSSVLPSQVDLNFSTAFLSSRSSSFNTATIPSQDFPVFTTDSQSTWPPSSSQSLPAPSAQQFPLVQPLQQDFVLFDQPTPSRSQPNRPASHTSALNLEQRRHSSHHQSSSSLQNQRVAQIIQAIGHPTTSSAFANRFSSSSPNSNQFYASSAPSSSVALNQQNRAARPPVPLFPHSTGNLPQSSGKMNIQGMLDEVHDVYPCRSPVCLDADADDFTRLDGGGPASAYSSPAMPTVFDMNGGSSSSSTNMGTVSPQDLLIQEPFMSAPNSTAFTALTSPSIYNESPEFTDSFDVSPHFGSADFDNGSNDPWFPLFPQENAMAEKPADHSPAQGSDDLEIVEFTSASSRRKSGNSSPSGAGRHASVSGVNSRKRDKPLPPIIVEDPNDVIAMKRARNTLAARKSRERKAQRLDELEEKIAKLEEERDHWKRIALARNA